MTAKEISEKVLTHRSDNQKVYDFTAEQLQEFIDALCKEQRESCLNRWLATPSELIKERAAIITAPQPEGL